VKLVAGPDVRDYVDERGGAVYVWARGVGCCRGRTWLLDCATEEPDRAFELVHAASGFQVFATPGLREPDELHLELDRRGRLAAFWNGQSWIG
jgi:hypothetical protein